MTNLKQNKKHSFLKHLKNFFKNVCESDSFSTFLHFFLIFFLPEFKFLSLNTTAGTLQCRTIYSKLPLTFPPVHLSFHSLSLLPIIPLLPPLTVSLDPHRLINPAWTQAALSIHSFQIYCAVLPQCSRLCSCCTVFVLLSRSFLVPLFPGVCKKRIQAFWALIW